MHDPGTIGPFFACSSGRSSRAKHFGGLTASEEEELTVAGPTAAACRAKSEEDYGKANLVQQVTN